MELFASLLLDDLRDRPPAIHLVSQIAEGIKDLNHLVSNILGFTRAPVAVRHAPVDVVVAIEEGLRYSTALLAENRTAIVRRYGAGPLLAQADPGLVRQVFLNLVRNAVQAMGGEGTLTITAIGGETIQVSFADTGSGIPSDARQRIFDPFFTTKERGTGLGLAVVRTLLDAVGGDVIVSEAEGQGACFTVCLLPAAVQLPASSAAPSPGVATLVQRAVDRMVGVDGARVG
jgi:signal transduction histidine kinase